MKPRYIKGRHTSNKTEITMDDPLNGILRRENKKLDVLIEASSTIGGNVYDLLKAERNIQFWTKNEENSFIKASLSEGKTFILKSYMIRNTGHLKHWRLEGQKASNGEWILLDRHSNEPFDQLVVKTFNVLCKEELKAVKLTQEGKSTIGNYYLKINAFDIFGVLIN